MSNYLNSCKELNPLSQITDQVTGSWWQGNPESGSLITILQVWMQRYCQRRDLSTLPSRLLKDIGITREQALREAKKPFWAE
jgi:uncharacterized protein YjiS (DUF1127 family)